MAEDKAFKNLFNQTSVGELADAVQAVYPSFARAAFLAQVFDDHWVARELKQRMRHITLALSAHLPADFRAALDVLRAALPRLGHQGLEKMVFPDFVEVNGLDDYAASMPALELFTQHMSAEFAIRPFIVRYPAQTMAQMLAWASHPNADVRRLASEGCRPRLPWGMALPALQADPSPILPILEQLKNDPSEMVRRSVANNLNDITKNQPALVVDLLRRWQADGSPEMKALTSHALRTLVKAGDPAALALLGYGSTPAIAITHVVVEPAVISLGDKVVLTFDVTSTGTVPQELVIDYVVHLVRANGSRTPKVFKLSRKTIQPGETVHMRKQHSFAPVTTRRYYPGTHAIQPQVNGQAGAEAEFEVIAPR
jgi:3-methyladenine DNA glycosylase AlkC